MDCRVDEGPLSQPPGFDPTCQSSDLGGYYCFDRFNATRVKYWCYHRRDGSCPPVNITQIATFVKHLGACMKVCAGQPAWSHMQHAMQRSVEAAVEHDTAACMA
jgi:hypothetical protein